MFQVNNSFTHFFPYNYLAYKNIHVTSKKKIKNDTQAYAFLTGTLNNNLRIYFASGLKTAKNIKVFLEKQSM